MRNAGLPSDLIGALGACRAAEREQTLFYRALAARAELEGDAAEAERLNALHADEQHHLSRLTARLIELGARPGELPDSMRPVVDPSSWEEVARGREQEEVARYEELLGRELDPQTRRIVEEILESERHHAAELGGKWMMA
ncbi:MAG: ferritin-like domain-containing protein [Gemmatimonadetes bacterium]|nr:ferritin-like domain-containing protein [Gemmatimonadota bacterium]